jgi:hypothetical protein
VFLREGGQMFSRHLVAFALLATSVTAHAVYTINIVETGANVVMTGSGSLNTTGLTFAATAAGCTDIRPDSLCIGSGFSDQVAQNALTPALTGFATAGQFNDDARTGDSVFIFSRDLFVPSTYVSGSPLSSSSTFNGRTFASMGLTLGTRTLTLPNNDTIVINITNVPPTITTPVPTLGQYGIMALASLMAMVGMWMSRRRQ